MLNLPLVTMLFVGVNLDFFVILLFLLQKYRFKDTLVGYILGMLSVFLISSLLGQTIQTFVPEWAIGLLGLIPIYMGIKGEDDDEVQANHQYKGILSVLFIYIASCGADNIAVYVPVLATMSLHAVIITAIYFIILTIISITLAYYFGKLSFIQKFFQRWGEHATRIIYILIGLFVMIDTGLFTHILKWLF